MRRIKADMGELEGQVMHVMWTHGPVTAEAVREHLGRDLKDSTIRTVLRRLEQKGYARHTVENRTFIYSASQPRQHAAAKAVKSIVDWFCNGSVDEVLVGMVDARMLDKEQLEKLAKRIDQAKKAKRGAKGD